MNRDLADWLDYQLRTHPQAIAMGLERVREVATRLGLGRPGKFVITVAGTTSGRMKATWLSIEYARAM